jgi:CheY-like chemotaxis protein
MGLGDESPGYSMRALIVEDEALVAMALADVLGELGFRMLRFAASEAEAVSQAIAAKPDVMLVDVQLRPGDGREAVRVIRGWHPDVPVVYCSANADLIRPGPNETVIDKPFSAAAIRDALVRLGVHAVPPMPVAV